MATTENVYRTLLQAQSVLSQALFDGEGTISRNILSIYNTDLHLLLYIRDLLSNCGIRARNPYVCKRAGSILKDPRLISHDSRNTSGSRYRGRIGDWRSLHFRAVFWKQFTLVRRAGKLKRARWDSNPR